MRITIKDVAQAAAVSPSTVSRVISRDKRISPATQERVRQAMARLGYHPNAIARSLVKQASNTLGLIMSRPTDQALSHPFFPEVIRGISSVTRRHLYNLLLSTSVGREQEHSEALSMLRNRQVDGIVLLASYVDDQLVDELSAEGHPFVVIGRVQGRTGVPSVNNDNVAAAREAVEHLIGLGHQSIGFLGGAPDLVVTQDRLEGYRQAMAKAGLGVAAGWVHSEGFSQEDGYQAAKRLLQEPVRITAIFGADDILMLGAMRAIREAGLRVPADVALVGFNDDPTSSWVQPPLSTVRVPIFDLGIRAAEMLIAQIQGIPIASPHVLLPTELVVRASCGAGHNTVERKTGPQRQGIQHRGPRQGESQQRKGDSTA